VSGLTLAVVGGTLDGEHWPGDGPTVVLLHAGVADRRSWGAVVEALAARGANVVAYDRRGFGQTPAGAGTFRHLDDLLTVLRATTNEPAWLVGSSQGGLLALDLALTEPRLVAGLILLAPAVSGAPDPPDEGLDAATRRLSDAIDEAHGAGRIDEVNELEVRLWLDGPAGPAGRVSGPPRALALDMNAIALRSGAPEDAGQSGLDAWSAIEEIQAPTTLAWGDLDIPFIITRCQTLANRLPNLSTTQVLTGNAHLPYLEQPQRVTELIAHAVGLP